MARLIPNANTWIGFKTVSSPSYVTSYAASSVSSATNLTPFLISLNASAQLNVLPAPAMDSIFERTISGTEQGTLSADLYRDDSSDTAWSALGRGVEGYFIVARFGTAGATPTATKTVELWPVRITQRSMSNMANNTILTFTVQATVLDRPNEAVVLS